MEAYVYRAALLCQACGESMKARLYKKGPLGSGRTDSDHYPQGPYSDGGGEADGPNHCDHCGVFLENPLTVDGFAYVQEAVNEAQKSKQSGSVALAQWALFYNIKPEES